MLSLAALYLSPRRMSSGVRAILGLVPLVSAFLFGESELHLSQSSSTAQQARSQAGLPFLSHGSVPHDVGRRRCAWHFSGNHGEAPGPVHAGRTEHKLVFGLCSSRCHLQNVSQGTRPQSRGGCVPSRFLLCTCHAWIPGASSTRPLPRMHADAFRRPSRQSDLLLPLNDSFE